MITLETLREQINSLHRLKTDVQIQSEIQEIFYDLIYADQMLYVKMSSSVPAISQSTISILIREWAGKRMSTRMFCR